MELGPILRALLHNRARFWLVTLQIALTLAVVANCLLVIRDTRREILRPTGLDEANQLVIEVLPWGEEFREDGFVDQQRESDLGRLRAVPGVRAATAISNVPLSGGGSGTGRMPAGSPPGTTGTRVQVFEVASDALETLGVELSAGRDFAPGEFVSRDEESREAVPALVTQALADKLYPDGDAIGKSITSSNAEEVNSIVGILRRMHGQWPLSSLAEDVMLVPGEPGTDRRMYFLVRAEPAQAGPLHTQLDEVVLALNPRRTVEIEPMVEVKAETYGFNHALVQILAVVSAALLLVTALGIVGLTSFSVTERTRQIGTRRALGATRTAILRYFLIENWIVTAAGLALGIALTYALNFALSEVAGAPKMDGLLVVAGMLALWAVGQLATLVPAWRSMAVPPVVATRTV